uniref:Lipoprotein n=1 Tax=Candidatus Kentrum sp. SD TaxID=2126332 RepID=A0A451BI86_9GAMM|nr:MAG: hypothetical protein BECKSD772D_GA0070982_100448 [Candidatus Kentron sp. SD]
MKKALWPILATTVALSVSGCAFIKNHTVAGQFIECKKEAKELANGVNGKTTGDILDKYEKKLDGFLGCFIGPRSVDGDELKMLIANSKGKLSDDTNPFELTKSKKLAFDNNEGYQLLRAHMIATIIARYAAFNIDGKLAGELEYSLGYSNASDDAEDSLASIARVEHLIRARSGLFKSTNQDGVTLEVPDYYDASKKSKFDVTPTVKDTIKRYGRLYRALLYLDAVKEASTPTVRRGRSLIRGIVGAIASGNVGNLKDTLSKVTTSVLKLKAVQRFALAYRIDTNGYLLQCVLTINDNTNQPYYRSDRACGNDLKGHWEKWDKLLKPACKRLNEAAEIKKVGKAITCTPWDYK